MAQSLSSPAAGLPVAGIGASAGSAGALRTLLGATAPGSGLVYVVIQDAGAVALDSEALGRDTALPVQCVERDVALERGHVYIVSRGCAARLAADRLRVSGPSVGSRARRGIDDFFRSLALERQDRAIGVVLSGIGTHGTAGARAIRAAGGAFLAQDPCTAEFSGMASSVIAAGCADCILPPQGLAHALSRLTSDSRGGAIAERTSRPLELDPGHFKEVASVLLQRTGRDLRGYRPDGVLRRVSRRMILGGIDSLPEYLRRLREDPLEAAELAEGMLVSFTAFLRNPRAWDALRETVIRPLVTSRGPNHPIRAWVPGCASGEEAYSLGMMIIEEAAAAGNPIDFKIYATDPSQRSLRIGRAGTYPLGIEAELARESLERFFEREPHRYRVRRELRERVFFAPHDLLENPPLPSLDLVSCRNVLMYLGEESQRRALSLLHCALRGDGHLFLGTSESPQIAEGLFAPVSRPWRIYRRTNTVRRNWPRLIAAAPLQPDVPPAETEISCLRRELQASADALQVSAEELESAHEEVAAISAELQCANAELASSKLRLESGLREKQAAADELKRVLEGTHVAVLLLDENLKIRFFTPATQNLLGLIPGDIGRPVGQLAPKSTDDRLLEDARAVLQGSMSLEAEVLSHSGRWYLRSAQPHLAENGRTGGVVVTFVDISSRKREVLELEAANARLREALESSEALRDQAERANRSKDEFIATVSHELRTPLNTIRLWSRMLVEGKLSPADVVHGAKLLERSALAQQKLVEDLLDISRMSRGQLRLELKDGPITEAVESAVAQTMPLAQAREIQLAADLTGGTGAVRADADRIQQVAENLLTNAIKFTPAGGCVHVRLHAVADRLELEVRDTGMGIDPQFLPFVFDRFRQGATDGARRGGLGLGLAITKQLVELHGGTISAESQGPGRGATFRVRLPVRTSG